MTSVTAIKKPNPHDAHIGSRIRMARMMSDMSQEKLGRALGITFQQVQKYEKGTNRVGGGRLQQIAQILQVSPSFFFDGLPGHTPAKNANEVTLATAFFSIPGGSDLAETFIKIESCIARRSIVNVARAVAGGRLEAAE